MNSRLQRLLGVCGAVLASLFGMGPEGLYGLVLFAGVTSQTSDASLTNAMKIIFDDSMVNSVVTDTELLDSLPEGGGIQVNQTTGGRYIETSNMFGLPAGVGARAEGGYIPVPQGPTIVNGQVTLKKVMGAVEMTAEVLKRVRTDIGAFIDWGDRALPALVERVTSELDRMLVAYATGAKARINDATPATNLVIDSSHGVTGWDNYLVQFLDGETITVSPNADGTSMRATVAQVTAVDFDNDYIVVDDVTAFVDDDFIFVGDAAGNNSGSIEPMGLAGCVDDGGILNVFQNINRTTYPKWRAYVMDVSTVFGTTQTLTEEVIQRADDEAFIRGGARIDMIVTSRVGLRQLWVDLKGDRSINDPRGSFTGGLKGVTMMLAGRTMEVRVARKLPSDICYGITRSSFRKWMLHRWEWDDTTGSIWKQVTDSTGRRDAFYAYGSLYLEVGCRDPQKNFRVENFSV